MTDDTTRFAKNVSVQATDADRRVAVAAALVPNKVDLQGDYFRPETVATVADDYLQRVNDDATQGVMHAVFPDERISLAESRVLDSRETIGSKALPAGTWVVGLKAHDDELWGLLEDGIITGVSIGGRFTQWEAVAPDELPPAVDLPARFPDDELVTRIDAARVDEISYVDAPAVPDATIATVKDAGDAPTTAKSILDRVDSRQEFLAVMAERGHDEADADRLWTYLQGVQADDPDATTTAMTDTAQTAPAEGDAATAPDADATTDGEPADGEKDAAASEPIDPEPDADDAEGASEGAADAGEPAEGDAGDALDVDDVDDVDDATLGKRLKRFLLGAPVDKAGAEADGQTDDGESPEDMTAAVKDTDLSVALDAAKAGRTLNQQNRRRLMAAHDAIEAALSADGTFEFESNRFTDNPEYSADFEFSAPDAVGDAAADAEADAAADAEADAEAAKAAWESWDALTPEDAGVGDTDAADDADASAD